MEKKSGASAINFDFKPGILVLVQNSKFDKILSDKTKPHYFGPMMVIKRTKGGSYVLGELNGALSKPWFATFLLLLYLPRNLKAVLVTKISDALLETVEELTHDSGNHLDMEDDEEL